MRLIISLLIGTIFGIILTKSQVISWFRIQEMFRFDSFHMYGIIGSAVVVAAISLIIIRKLKMKSIYNDPVQLKPKKFHKGTLIGGMVFGLGWALTGACPGPLYALIGNGYSVIFIALLSAIGGTLAYGLLRNRLPH